MRELYTMNTAHDVCAPAPPVTGIARVAEPADEALPSQGSSLMADGRRCPFGCTEGGLGASSTPMITKSRKTRLA